MAKLLLLQSEQLLQILRFFSLTVLQLILGLRNLVLIIIVGLWLMGLGTLNEVLVVLHTWRVWWRHHLVLVFLDLTDSELAIGVAD